MSRFEEEIEKVKKEMEKAMKKEKKPKNGKDKKKIVYVYQDKDNGVVEVFKTLETAKACAEANWPDEEDEWKDSEDQWNYGEYVTIYKKEIQ